jgi:hypothetical protein
MHTPLGTSYQHTQLAYQVGHNYPLRTCSHISMFIYVLSVKQKPVNVFFSRFNSEGFDSVLHAVQLRFNPDFNQYFVHVVFTLPSHFL